ncbi:hypothetical protein [Pseudoruegeria sp. HB172150]|uniref:hypothetical protein n=1 Tax=Pseudoruegeria sp. HB172150 TaxID=2721164 RepID=UPI001556F30D|nr:hypothetical protein [Pseudoruegeria sp. HB172150]
MRVKRFLPVAAGTLMAAALAIGMSGAARADPVADILAEAAATCASFENGAFDPRDAVAQADLTGDGAMDTLIDESRFSCSSGASMFCGSGGCLLHAVIGDRSWSYQAEGWRLTDWDGRPVLLIARDGGWCGGAGAQLCYEAVTWSAGEMLTVMPQGN